MVTDRGDSLATLPPPLAALLDGRAYPHRVGTIELIETHISWVLLTGDYAYKIKRPVQYSFVDFRSLASREFYCREELRLNRRYAPDLYLDVCPIARRDGTIHMGGAGTIIEYAVRMRQFDPAQELASLVERQAVSTDELRGFGASLGALHATAPVAANRREPDRTSRVVLGNITECRAALSTSAARASLDRIAVRLRRQLETRLGLIAQRARTGFIRECHGDLHTRNVARIGNQLTAFDCLEFEPEFRTIDVAQEVAFLAMDLQVLGRADLASAFVNGWLAETGDYQAVELLDLFEAHCALVRAKVCSLSLQRQSVSDQAALRQHRDRYIDQAATRLARASPELILMHGLSGSGKSWLAERLALAMPAVQLRSDLERKRRAGLTAQQRSGSRPGEGLYQSDQTAATYAHLLELAAAVLRGGRSVLVDATFMTRAARAQFVALGARFATRPRLIECRAPDHVLQQRLLARERSGDDPSDADLAVLAWQRAHAEPVTATEGLDVLVVDTTDPDVVDQTLWRMMG
ncbi:MAG: AAA family ATPase [Pseudomonadales bacterium]|nr:AAA family ATPase [Pseudomonadales bacterium]